MSTILLATVVVTILVVLLSLLVQQIRSFLLPSRIVQLLVNEQRHIEARTGYKLLNELANADIALPSGCAGAGTCGLCKLTIQSGANTLLPIERALLTDQECADGVRLACQVTVQQDMTLNVAEGVLSAERWNCTVASSRNVSPLIKEIVLDLPEGQSFNFTPGNYIQVSAPSIHCEYDEFVIDAPFQKEWQSLSVQHLVAYSDVAVDRAYSMANQSADSVSQQTQIVLLIRLALPPPHKEVPPGKMSSYLFSLAAGDSVDVSGPYGDFTVRENPRPKVFIGGGVGMAPLRSMIHSQLKSSAPSDILFYYGARSFKDLFYQKEFDELQSSHPNFQWTVALSQPEDQDNWNGNVGFIHETVNTNYMRDNPEAVNSDYYLCGPSMMLESVTDMLLKAGVEKDQIYADSFG